jgi:hypothetical protein
MLGYSVAAIALFCCYLRESNTLAVTSDGASNALQAWDMLHGNLMLHGWTVSDVSFYTTELPEYMIAEAIRGLGPFDVHYAAALTYTLLILLAGLVAKGRATGREGLLRALIASGIMIAPQVGPGAFILLLSPDHTGTGVPLLAIWLLLIHAPRRAWVPVLTGLALTWVTIGDRITSLMCALPIAVVCAIRIHRGRDRQATRFELQLGGAALVSLPAAWVVVQTITWTGGYSVQPILAGVASPTTWWPHIRLATEGILSLFGADFFHRTPGMFTAVALVHLTGLSLAIWAFCLGVRRLRSGSDLVEAAMTIAIAVNVVVYTFSDLPHTQWDTREMAVLLPYGAVLAGRLLTNQLSRPSVKPLVAAWAASYALALVYAITQPARPAHDQDLATWLAGHHMTCGLGSYAEANSTTLDSAGRIELRAPTWTANGVHSRAYESKAS